MLLPVGRIDGCVLNGVAAVDHDPITDVNADVRHTGGVIRPDKENMLATIAALIYNVVSSLVGGVHVTLGDD